MSAQPALDAAAFVRANTRLQPAPYVPEIRLHLAHEALPLWRRTEEELGGIGLPPPFWAFAWAGGQALARHVLDHPGLVRGAHVLDFASGSGLVALSAARAGAARVEAADIDPFALAAIHLNAEANTLSVAPRAGDLVGRDEGWDCVLAGDIFYQRDIADRVVPWLEALHARGALVLLGDPGRSYLPLDRLDKVAEHWVPVTRELEDSDVKRRSVWRFRA